RVDPLVVSSIVDLQLRLDLRRLVCAGLRTVERHARGKVGQPRREHIDHPATPAESDGADLPGAIGKALQEVRRSDEIRARLRLVELGEELARLVLVAGVTAQR